MSADRLQWDPGRPEHEHVADAHPWNDTRDTRATLAVDGSTISCYIWIGDISASGPPVAAGG